MSIYSIDKLMAEARRLAVEYRDATGKNLPITSEIAINDAIRILGMTAAEKSGLGYDALYPYQDRELKVQIKGRAVVNDSGKAHRIGQLKTEQDWDAIVLVLMDRDYETDALYLAHRHDIEHTSKLFKTNKRGALTVAKFKAISECVWQRDNAMPTTPAQSETVEHPG